MHRAKVMAKSWKLHYPEVPLVLCLVEQSDQLDSGTRACFDHVLLAKDLHVPHFLSIMFGYEVGEATCSLKSDLLNYMLKKFPEEQEFMYLDSDIRLYSRLNEAEEALKKHNLVITPHLLGFPPKIYINFFGVFNTGFLAIRRSDQVTQFLDWWRDKLRFHCYISCERGAFLDQTWLNVVPSIVDTHVCYHPGYNVSFWNAHEGLRQFSTMDSPIHFSSGYPLRFIHFSRLHHDFAAIANSRERDPSGILGRLLQAYHTELEQTGLLHATHIPWSYNYYTDGSKIDSQTKLQYRLLAEKQIPMVDPFLGYGHTASPMSEQQSVNLHPKRRAVSSSPSSKRRKKRKWQTVFPKLKCRKTARLRIIRKKRSKR